MEKTKRLLITGGCGFIGHHFVEHFLKTTNWHIVILDRLNYASSGFDRLRDINVFDDKRVTILASDFTNPLEEGLAREIGQLEHIIHMGAETHVDNSITDPRKFTYSNVVGTLEMLEFVRHYQPNLKKFFYFSTDEVFGPAPMGYDYKEEDRHNPTNPYSATKSGGEMLVKAYINTYKLPAIITRTMNVFGERQHLEKFIPMTIRKVLAGEKVLIHADKTKTVSGSRYWIHARNAAAAYSLLIARGEIGKSYHIVGEKEVSNLHMAQFIAKTLGKPLKYEMTDFHSSRPGHDLRYGMDDINLKALGWKIPIPFEESLTRTTEWMLKNPKWLKL